mmetsp:Transcript_22984/g.63978  ORF Transcript_22984/g.63978 Transcript_22984/m.63978 type:complete len:643 (-) Transcript_22984:9-1937(-)
MNLEGSTTRIQRQPFSMSDDSTNAPATAVTTNAGCAATSHPVRLPSSWLWFRSNNSDGGSYQEIHDDNDNGHDDDVVNNGNDKSSSAAIAQAFLHLVKGYVGPGCLSLPWAVSQLGLTAGIAAVFFMALWSSYNCWLVVQLKNKQLLLQEQQQQQQQRNSTNNHKPITYPDVSQWLCGRHAYEVTQIAICVQQLAICTVFVSFVGTNLEALLQHYTMESSSLPREHVLALTLPAILALSLLPDLSSLAPITALGTTLLLAGLAVLGVVVVVVAGGDKNDMNDHNDTQQRQDDDATSSFHWSTAPLALCAILYSYEGICLILPVESAMTPDGVRRRHFGTTFIAAMTTAAVIFAVVAGSCVAAFGKVSNGSITAFLLQEYSSSDDDNRHIFNLILVANALVSLSVLVTYPLQLFPAVELVERWLQQRHRQRSNRNSSLNEVEVLSLDGDDETGNSRGIESLAEPNNNDLHSTRTRQQHERGNPYQSQLSLKTVETTASSSSSSNPSNNGTHNNNRDHVDDDEPDGIMMNTHNSPSFFYTTRIGLVMVTFLIATLIPNVQTLISLAGAVAGSSTALLIPPVLQIAWLKKQQQQQEESSVASTRSPSSFGIELTLCYVLFFGGVVFLLIGAIASCADIARAYTGH